MFVVISARAQPMVEIIDFPLIFQGPVWKTLIFRWCFTIFYRTATLRKLAGNSPTARRQPAGTRNSALAEDADNKILSLVALGKMGGLGTLEAPPQLRTTSERNSDLLSLTWMAWQAALEGDMPEKGYL